MVNIGLDHFLQNGSLYWSTGKLCGLVIYTRSNPKYSFMHDVSLTYSQIDGCSHYTNVLPLLASSLLDNDHKNKCWNRRFS